MFDVNLPAFEHKIRTVNGKKQIFDPLRRKFVALTPEEWVRQHFVNYLVTHKGYPPGRLVNEAQIRLNGLVRRCDAVFYDKSLKPTIVMEFKAPTVVINQSVFEQVAAYNWALRADYLMVSNGLVHYCCQYDYVNHRITFLGEIPFFSNL